MGFLRFVLAIVVVIAHSQALGNIRFVGGVLAVQSFYMISGFYMALILNEKYIGISNRYYIFLSNRLLKLFPIYWVVLLLTILYSIYSLQNGLQSEDTILYYLSYFNLIDFKTFVFLVFTNIFLFFQDIVMFLGLDNNGEIALTSNFWKTEPKLYKFLFIPQAWTIGIELMFYTLAPFLASKRRLPLVMVILILSLSTRFYLIFNGLNHDPWTYRFFPAELFFFMLGIICYHFYNKIRYMKFDLWILYVLLSAFILNILLYEQYYIPFKKQLFFTSLFISIPFIFKLTINSKIDRTIGDLSYPIYISHILIISLVKDFNLNIQLVIVLVIIFSYFLNRAVSNKVESLRSSRLRRV